jgi:hypothetical protein
VLPQPNDVISRHKHLKDRTCLHYYINEAEKIGKLGEGKELFLKIE